MWLQLRRWLTSLTFSNAPDRSFPTSKERLKHILTVAPVNMALLTLDGRFLGVNESMCQMLGYNEAELLAKTFHDVTHPDDITVSLEHVRIILADKAGKQKFQKRYQHKSGAIVWALTTIQLTQDEPTESAYFIAQVQDITQQKQTEAELMTERTLLRAVIDNLPDYIYLKDLDHRIVLSNEANAISLGATTSHEVIGKTLFDFYPPEEAERYNALDKIVLGSGRAIVNQENTFVDISTGQQKWSLLTRLPFPDSSGAIVGTLGVSQNITEQKLTESMLQDWLRFENLVSIISTNFIGLAAKDIDNGIEEAIKRIAELVGAVRSSVILFSDDLQTGSNTHEWCADSSDSHKTQLQEFPTDLFNWYFIKLKRLEPVIVSRSEDLSMETRAEREWIAQYGFRALLCIPMISNNKLVGALGFYGVIDQEVEWPKRYVSLLQLVADIIVNALTRKRVEEQLQASLQEKEVLLKEIHHRVKNNMQVISSLLDLQSAYVADEAVQVMFQDSRSRVRSMALVHEKLYQSSDLGQINFTDYVHDLLAYLLRIYRHLDGQVTVEINMADVALSVETAVPLGLILNELVSNAYKHGFVDDRSGRISVQLTWKNSQLMRLTIHDTGIGLPPDITHLQSKSLGLTIVHTLVGQLKGIVEWGEGDGTTWHIDFPLSNLTTSDKITGMLS